MRRRQPRATASQRAPVLGTVLSVQVTASGRRALAQAERSALAEIARLEAVFSIFDGSSELRRWAAAETDIAVSEDLRALLALALDIQVRSRGAFNPAAGEADRLWRSAEADRAPPSAEALKDLAATIAQPRYRIADDQVTRLGDCRGLTFNALAKGLIVDRSARCAWCAADLDSLVVNLGGDLVHRGAGAAMVGIENPLRPFDNEPPLATARLSNAAMATSGRARRGYRVGERWFGHVIDPRTCRPTDGVASATVVTEDAATADALATIVCVLGPSDGLGYLASLHPQVAAMVVADDGTLHCNDGWAALAG